MPYDTKGETPFSFQLRPNPDVLSQTYDDSVVLLNLSTDKFFHLNRTGARFWELLGERSNLTEIHETMSREFDVEGSQLEAEMTALISDLREQDLVKVV